ncbi:SDR family NAD(P)-dependent oxidoreductase [Streptomyces aidingensis]|uniref:NADP-dependent 3-hydroxy acid dehydrogenase YdfG n=1 Tax=Streptomyces aidingensis TaxID=910347 RepID=A0A1I1EAV4_9ACTN|nr:SDR family oxidoreductase [Streptomyces aidingensis]SFB84274.1 NADP-dependent 3-hydroxy acid dehydrogenase YdfG [Streptomyces aidingensis]
MSMTNATPGTAATLAGKNAVIYGGGGAIGGAVARAFAARGARVFLAGRTAATLEAVAEDITAAGGTAETAVVDALDGDAVAEHAHSVAGRAGSLDISFNLVTRGDVQGSPLTAMSVADFVRPVTNGVTANFLTATTAARIMTGQESGGVILTLNSGSAKGSPMMGGTGPADAAQDTLVRNLAVETGPQGVRVVGIWTAGLPETLSVERLRQVSPGMEMDQDGLAALISQLDSMRMTRRSPTLAQIAATAAFLASDQAGSITGTFVNATGGMFTD